MFGYVVANPDSLTESELARYRGCYCGLCRTLKRRHHSHLTLTYDMTFLVLLLGSLYEPAERAGQMRCAAHPLREHSFWTSEFTDYGADMNLALAYHNCMDDWRDERKLSRWLLAASLRRRYLWVRERYPRQCGAMEACMERLAEIERTGGSADEAAGCFGALMGELFVWKEDLWSGILRRMGAALGRFIYMMDAVMDLESDEKHGRYNPIRQTAPDSVLRTEPETALAMLLAECRNEFEKLPLVLDCALERKILSDGVWQKFAAWRGRQEGGRHGEGPV
ncbi:MAG: DUF5685 family protein [Bradyrhizobium sp.]